MGVGQRARRRGRFRPPPMRPLRCNSNTAALTRGEHETVGDRAEIKLEQRGDEVMAEREEGRGVSEETCWVSANGDRRARAPCTSAGPPRRPVPSAHDHRSLLRKAFSARVSAQEQHSAFSNEPSHRPTAHTQPVSQSQSSSRWGHRGTRSHPGAAGRAPRARQRLPRAPRPPPMNGAARTMQGGRAPAPRAPPR